MAVLILFIKLQALVYDILHWRKVPESDARSVIVHVVGLITKMEAGGL